jgi:hypothetical protein
MRGAGARRAEATLHCASTSCGDGEGEGVCGFAHELGNAVVGGWGGGGGWVTTSVVRGCYTLQPHHVGIFVTIHVFINTPQRVLQKRLGCFFDILSSGLRPPLPPLELFFKSDSTDI